MPVIERAPRDAPSRAAPAPDAAPGRSAWRSDIDGLRALAVGPVVVFHLAQSYLRGGYVGVDIFFVISGYLIGRNVFGATAAGRFSIARFYEHRLRRIFPAYAAVLACVLAVALVHQLPPDAAATGRAALAAIASLTNVHFWLTADYFAQPAESLPLLHTWSLSVEEQFYLLFPALAVWAARGTRGRLKATFVALFLASLTLSVPGAFLYPTGTFYLLPTRAWELLLGSLLALGLAPSAPSRAVREIEAGAGLALITLSMVLLTPDTPFPGLAALPPCLGAALILHAGESGGSLVARLLSIRPIAFLGLISYSLYLWHWPVLALQRADMLLFSTDSKLAERAGLLGLSLVLAVLSWWLIERPTRDRARLSTRRIVVGSAVAAAILTAVSAALIATGGLPGRFSPEAAAAAAFLDHDQTAQFRQGRCFLGVSEGFARFDAAACLPEHPGRPSYILLGDSHAAHLYAGLARAMPGADILQITGVQCPPLVVPQPHVGSACPELIALAADALPARRRIAGVVLSAAWNGSRLSPSAGWNADWFGDLKRTVAHFRSLGIAPVLVGPNPEYRLPLPSLLARAAQAHDPGLPARNLVPDPFALDRTLAAFAAENGVRYVSLIALLCRDGTCREHAAPGVPLFFDASHFTEAGSDLVAEAIARALR